MAGRTPLDNDMWWHLRAGQETWSSGHPYLIDTLSYTRYGHTWISHAWLSEVVMYLLFNWGKFLALGGLVAFLATLSMALLYLQMEGPAILRAFIIIFGSLVASTAWSPRPQSFSLALMALTALLLQRYRRGRNTLFWLIPIFILWSNLHGGYILGLMLIFLTAAGEALNHLWRDSGIQLMPWKRIGWLLLSGLAGALVTLINPNGLNMWLIPFNTIAVNANQLISEWASPDFHNLIEQSLLWLLFATIAAMGFSRKRVDAVDLLILLWFAYMAFMAKRNYGPFAIAVIPILCKYAWEMIKQLRSENNINMAMLPLANKLFTHNDDRVTSRSSNRYANLSIVAILAFFAFGKLYVVTQPSLVNTYEQQFFPAAAVRYIQQSKPPGNLMNEYNWGGYLTWYLRDYPVFIDSRTDLFGDEIIDQWTTVLGAREGWGDILDRWQVRLILVKPDRAIAQLLPGAGWKLLYQDEQSVLFSR